MGEDKAHVVEKFKPYIKKFYICPFQLTERIGKTLYPGIVALQAHLMQNWVRACVYHYLPEGCVTLNIRAFANRMAVRTFLFDINTLY